MEKLYMPVIKIDRDVLLDKVYECRGKIDFTNKEALDTIEKIVDMIVNSQLADNQSLYPKIKIGR